MEKLPPFRGISRDEYRLATRLCPRNPAFMAGYEEWTRTTLKEIERICKAGRIAERKQS